MKNLLLCIACILVILSLTGGAGAAKMQVPDYRNSTIVTNASIILDEYEAYLAADALPNETLPDAMPARLKGADAIPEQHDIRPFIQYDAWERDQNPTGTCWVWAGTAILEASLGYENGYPDRLSVQYFVSGYNNGGTSGEYAGSGGTALKFQYHYNGIGKAVPWNNTNADWQDAAAGVPGDVGPTSVPLGSISTSPDYDLNGLMKVYRVRTYYNVDGVDYLQAVANIKGLINANRPVYFGWHGDQKLMFDSWFENFWFNHPASDMLDFTPWGYNHHPDTPGGHAVVIVGYYDDGTAENSYWTCLNSWGTAPLIEDHVFKYNRRPDGTFRLKMYQDYNVNQDDYYDSAIMQFWSLAFNVDAGLPGTAKAFTQDPPSVRNFVSKTTYPPDPETNNLTVWFNATDWGYPTGGVIDFGDGTTDSWAVSSPLKTGAYSHVFGHVYAPGTYSPTYTCSNTLGSNTSGLGYTLILNGLKPNSSFSYQNPQYCPMNKLDHPDPANSTVLFTDQSEYAPTSWYWEFGDGGTSTERNPTHTYTQEGKFWVLLRTENAYGSDTESHLIEVKWTTGCPSLFDNHVADKSKNVVWKTFPEDKAHMIQMMLDYNKFVTHPFDISATRIQKTESVPLYETVAGITAGDADGGEAFPADAALQKPVLSKDRVRLRDGINKTLKATIDTSHLKPGAYTFTVIVKDPTSGRTVSRIPAWFSIAAVPKIVVTPKEIALGTLQIGDKKTGEFTVKNPGSVTLNCTLTAPPEFVFEGGAESPIVFTVSPGASIPVTFRIDTQYRAQQGSGRSRFSGITIESNDPDNPLVEIPVTYSFNAPVAGAVAMDIPDQIVDAIGHDPSVTVNITMKNVGKEPWTNAYRLGVPDFGDGALFVASNSAGEGIVPVGKNATYRLVLNPLGNSSAYGNYTLAFEMYYPGAHGTPVFFGDPVFKQIHYGPYI